MINTTTITISFLLRSLYSIEKIMLDNFSFLDAGFCKEDGHDLIMVEFHGMDSCGAFGFEKQFQEAKVPYSKCYHDEFKEVNEEEHFRVLPDGSTMLTKFNPDTDLVINFDELRKATSEDFEAVIHLLKYKENKCSYLSWDEQVKSNYKTEYDSMGFLLLGSEELVDAFKNRGSLGLASDGYTYQIERYLCSDNDGGVKDLVNDLMENFPYAEINALDYQNLLRDGIKAGFLD